MIKTSKLLTLVHRSITGSLINSRTASTMNLSSLKFATLSITNPKEYVYQVQLNRPNKINALNNTMWEEIGKCFQQLGDSPDCRVVLLTGAGKGFCAGIDLQDAMSMGQELVEHEDIARKCRVLEKKIEKYQNAFTSIEKCQKPVIAAIHGVCIGGGFAMICAADIRYCSSSAWFSVKEVDIGLAPDVGALQWLPKIIGSESLARELAFTARNVNSDEALQCGLVNRLFKDDQTLFDESMALAELISQKSPVAVQTTKKGLIYSRDHTVQDGLNYMRYHNQTLLQSEDFVNAAMAQATKGNVPTFSKL